MEGLVTVVGAGLAGSECALQLARRGVRVRLFEQRPASASPAHHTDRFAELVCSNSLKSTKSETAAGLLKTELSKMGCVLLDVARQTSVPAGGALAVNRDEFSAEVTRLVEGEPLIEVVREEVRQIPEGPCVIAAGPLCSDALFQAVSAAVGTDSMSFFDAAAPIVDADSLDREVIFEQSRYEETGSGDYLNCPMNKEEYDVFLEALLSAERVIVREFEQSDLFCACQPVEEVARTGYKSLCFGALKPVGLTDPRTGRRPWAAVQLRAENTARTLYNLVGFQTNLKWGEQKRVFSMIPGLEHAEFVRYGVMHRNTFLESPKVLTKQQFLKEHPNVFFAGQITGFEGYMESAASGLLAAHQMLARLNGRELPPPPAATMCGALLDYITTPNKDFQPMGANMGILPRTEEINIIRDKRERYMALSQAAQDAMQAWVKEYDA